MVEELRYNRLRASQERSAALQARDPHVRHVHVEMAERYEERVRAMTVVGEAAIAKEAS